MVEVSLDVYCDESGITKDDPYCFVVGFLASRRNWQQFESRWHDATGGVDFHGTRFFARDRGARVERYRGWDDARAWKYLRGILDAITESDLRVIGGVVDTKAFWALGAEERRYLTGGRFTPWGKRKGLGAPFKPYFAAFAECYSLALKCVRRRGIKVNFVFDRQEQYSGYALQFHQSITPDLGKAYAQRLGDLSFTAKDGVGALQAADLLAYSLAKYKRGRLHPEIRSEMDTVATELRPIARNRIVLLDAETLEERLRAVGATARQRWRTQE